MRNGLIKSMPRFARIEIRVLRSAVIRLRGQKIKATVTVPMSAQADNCFVEDPDFNPGTYGLAFCFLSLLTLFSPIHAQTPPLDREAVYQKALPSYADTPSQPLAVKTVESKTLDGARFLRFSYLSAHGQRVPALLFTPLRASAKTPAPCLVLLHGLGGSKEIMAGLALFAAQSGYASLAIDEYGQGERTPTKPSERSQAEELAVTVQQSALDVRRGLDYLGTRRDINSKRIGLAGISLGAIIGTVAAGVDPRLKATALISGGGDWGLILKTLTANRTEVGGRSTAGLKNLDWDKASLLLAPEDPLTFAPHIAPRTLLLIGGRKDTTIVPQAQQELYDAARLPKKILWFDQYGHVPPPEVVYPALKLFFGARL
jgi:dienelactone hydrolase